MRYTWCETEEEADNWIYEFQYCRDVQGIERLNGRILIVWTEKFSSCGGD